MKHKTSRDAARSADLMRDQQQSVAPGKKPPTMALQMRSKRAPELTRSSSNAEAIQRQRRDSASWMDTAVRPDLNPAPVQRAAAGPASGRDLPADSSGQAMPDDVRAKMEGAFGSDFSNVRIHEGARSEALGAHAYTQGAEIHFAPGQFQPHSHDGQRLLGHELAHVVQQSQGRVDATTQLKGVGVNDDSGLEREADDMAARAVRGEPVGAGGVSAGGHSSDAPVQRYIKDDPALAPGKVSEGGAIAMVDDKTVYATEAKITEANDALDGSQATFKLSRGAELDKPDAAAWTLRFGEDPAMYRIKPIFKTDALSGEQAKTEPVEGDSEDRQDAKLTAYQDRLRSRILAIADLKDRVRKRWEAEAGKRSGLFGFMETTSVAIVVWGEFNGQINTLIADTMGPMWATTPAALAIFLPQGEARDRLTLDQHMQLFNSLAADYLAKFDRELAPELAMQELWMTLPNDCKNAARILTGKNEMELNEGTANPDIGENYSIHFPAAMDYGWATHFASVIMKDAGDANTDNLTFETAASIGAGMQEGKSLGFFEMYGTNNPVQTFEYISWLKNRANVNQQAEVGVEQATTPEAAAQVRRERDADFARIDMKLASLTPLPDDDDDL